MSFSFFFFPFFPISLILPFFPLLRRAPGHMLHRRHWTPVSGLPTMPESALLPPLPTLVYAHLRLSSSPASSARSTITLFTSNSNASPPSMLWSPSSAPSRGLRSPTQASFAAGVHTPLSSPPLELGAPREGRPRWIFFASARGPTVSASQLALTAAPLLFRLAAVTSARLNLGQR